MRARGGVRGRVRLRLRLRLSSGSGFRLRLLGLRLGLGLGLGSGSGIGVPPQDGGERERYTHDEEQHEGGRRELPRARLLCPKAHLVSMATVRGGRRVSVVGVASLRCPEASVWSV